MVLIAQTITTTGRDLSAIVKQFLPDLSPYANVYKDLHENAGLSLQETYAASLATCRLESLGFKVYKNIGGTGIVGVLENGAGHTVMLRADMDGLPILEETGLPYASKTRMRDVDGVIKPTMHACGHDMHVTCLMGAAELLHKAKSTWRGTLICLFQPNEEKGGGASAMVEDGLYDKIPIPHVVLGQHVNYRKAGLVAITSGAFMAAADSFEITVFGRGGHGSQPQYCIDPVVIVSYIIVKLQTIVSRVLAPTDVAVITCGSIHGGDGENIIPDQVVFKLNIRTYDAQVRAKVLDNIKRIIKLECEASGSPKPPVIKPISNFPVTNNNKAIATTLRQAFESHFQGRVLEQDVLTGSEDFSNLAKKHNIPYAFWFFGGTDAKQWDDAEKDGRLDSLPRNHSSKFAPAIQPTLQTGVEALSLAALSYLDVVEN